MLGTSPIFNTARGLYIPLNDEEMFVPSVFGPVIGSSGCFRSGMRRSCVASTNGWLTSGSAVISPEQAARSVEAVLTTSVVQSVDDRASMHEGYV